LLVSTITLGRAQSTEQIVQADHQGRDLSPCLPDECCDDVKRSLKETKANTDEESGAEVKHDIIDGSHGSESVNSRTFY
jgi:hypothetical protein